MTKLRCEICLFTILFALPFYLITICVIGLGIGPTGLFLGIKASFWVAAAIALVGALTSAVRAQ